MVMTGYKRSQDMGSPRRPEKAPRLEQDSDPDNVTEDKIKGGDGDNCDSG